MNRLIDDLEFREIWMSLLFCVTVATEAEFVVEIIRKLQGAVDKHVNLAQNIQSGLFGTL